MKKYTCFVISPIGEAGSKTREDADDLLALIVNPALERFGFEVVRGDHRSEANQIDIDVIKSVQDADLCICVLSQPNMNVYYELGRRDETGKPIILLRDRNSEPLPIDIATRRYIEYDLDSRSGIRDAVTQIQNFVAPIVDKGFEGTRQGATLGEIAAVLQRVERKVDRLSSGAVAATSEVKPVTPTSSTDPRDMFRLALRQRNIPLAEQAMELLQFQYDRVKWLDLVVEQVAAIGSRKAGAILIESAQEFLDSDCSFRKKIEYLGSLVSFLNRTDQEQEYQEQVETLCRMLQQISDGQDPEDLLQIPNQLNRLYHGIYVNNDDENYLNMAVEQLRRALAICEKGFLYYNLALCLWDCGDYEGALPEIDRCIVMDDAAGKQDANHIRLACRVYAKLKDPRLADMLEKLAAVDPTKAALLRDELAKQ